MAAAVRSIVLLVLGAAGAVAIASAPAASSSADIRVNVVAGAAGPQAANLPSGGTITVPNRQFVLGIGLENDGPDPATVRVSLQLPAGLTWGADRPDPSENCTSTATTADCAPPTLPATGTSHITGWLWNVTAQAPGSYPVTVSAVSSSAADPDPSNNSATATVVVTQKVAAGGVRVSPAAPRAGSVVVASVGVSPGAPSRPACSATVGSARAPARAHAGAGRVTCTVRTPRSARGKLLRGKLTFAVAGTGVVRRFAVRLH
jgi:hypothetical protein